MESMTDGKSTALNPAIAIGRNGSNVTQHRMLRRAAGFLAESPLFGRARRLWKVNQHAPWMPIPVHRKAYIGTYVVLADFSTGEFPPVMRSREEVYTGEINKPRDCAFG